MEYFATRRPNSPETEKVDRWVKWYQTDNETRKRYMTWQQEIDIAVDLERKRANEAEKLLSEAREQACAEKARADKYEKMLRDLGKL